VHAGIALMCPTFASKKASPPLFFVEDEAMHILKFVTQWNVSYFVLDLENGSSVDEIKKWEHCMHLKI